MSEPNTAPAIDIAGLAIAYGRNRVVCDLSVRVEHGQVYALLGRNGVGKSSLVRCLLGQQRATEGRPRLLGLDSWSHRHRLMAEVGVVAETPDMPPTMTPRALGTLHQRFYRDWSREHYLARLARFAVEPDLAFARLSRGQKTQVALSLALSSQPRLLVLDDPTLGLDPVARGAIYDELIEVLAERELTILIASHDLVGVECLATHVGFLSAGALLVDEPLETLKGRFRRLALASSLQEPESALAELAPVRWRRLPWGTEAVIGCYERARVEGLDLSTPPSDMSLEEIFVAVAGETQGEESEQLLRRVS